MNWLFCIIVISFLIGLIVGIIRGAVKIAVSLFATLITFLLVFFATPYVCKGITSVTPIQEVVETKIESMINGIVANAAARQAGIGTGNAEAVRNALSAAGIGEEQLDALGISVEDIAEGRISTSDLADMGISQNILDGLNSMGAEAAEALQDIEIPRDMQIAAIESADIPQVFKNILLTNNNSKIYDKLGVTSFASYVAKYMAQLVVNIVAFMLTLIVVTIVLRAVIFSLNVIADLPVFGFMNRLAGGVMGVIGVLIIVWAAFVIITVMYTTEIGREMFDMIQSNSMLSVIYEYNPIMKLATTLRM
ncbi:MAG: CvpA family protein [Dorea sp.]|nr:CvpA family protein [Dorea sp.]